MRPLEFVILSLGAYRLWRIAARDSITEKARRALTGYDDDQAPELEPDDSPTGQPRRYLSALIRCPWCLGFYVSVAVYTCWRIWPAVTLTVATPLAIAAALGLIRKNLDQ